MIQVVHNQKVFCNFCTRDIDLAGGHRLKVLVKPLIVEVVLLECSQHSEYDNEATK